MRKELNQFRIEGRIKEEVSTVVISNNLEVSQLRVETENKDIFILEMWNELSKKHSIHLVKAMPVYIEGYIKPTSWTDSSGKKHNKYILRCTLIDYPKHTYSNISAEELPFA